MRKYPRNGEGVEAFVDASDTGYTNNNESEVKALETAATKAGSLNGNGGIHGGSVPNGHVNGTNGVKEKLANGSVDDLTNGANGYTNGSRA